MFLLDLCIKEIEHLQNLKLINYNSENNQINPTGNIFILIIYNINLDLSEIIFKNNLQLDTFLKMFQLSGEESVEDLVNLSLFSISCQPVIVSSYYIVNI